MRIGILRSGLVGAKLGTVWARAGYDIVFRYARNMKKLERLALVVLSLAAGTLTAQGVVPPRTSVTAQITATTNGMSTIPAFTLGRPAALMYLFVRRGSWALEPELRTGLDGKPWALIIWGRYRVQHERFSLGVSAHPAINFKESPVTIGGVTRDMIVARRYLVGELTPTYVVSPSASLGMTYLYLHGVENDVVKHTNFVALRSALTAQLLSGFALRVAPQAYYLHMGSEDGTYVFGQATLSRRTWPLSLSAAANEPLHTRIVAGNAFSWNVSGHYTIQ